MRTVLLVMLAVFCSTLCALGQEVNQQDPAAVARAYLDACEKWDAEAAGRLALDEWEAQRLLDLAREPGPGLVELGLGEVLCLPLTRRTRYLLGEVATTGDEAWVKAVATYSAPLTLVLRKGDDGKWRVAVRESVLSTTGAQEPMLLGEGETWWNPPGSEAQQACLANLKQLAIAILCYVQDHDQVLPPAETWRDDLWPYVMNASVFQCPANPWGYTYNAALSKKPLGQIANPAETICLFEVGHAEPNMAADLNQVQWAHRHNGGDNVAYVDGHAQWRPGQ